MPTKLLYIVSAGHSGSTLLDIVCGTIPGVFSAGEITYFPWQISRRGVTGQKTSKQKLCSCQKGFNECEVWYRVIESISRMKGYDIYENPFKFDINLLGNKKYKSRRISAESIRRHIFRLGVQVNCKTIVSFYRSNLSESIKNNWLLFDTVAQVTKSKVVVDSSKSINRVNLLASLRPRDVYILILKRDIKGVVYSNIKLGRDPLKTAKGWVKKYRHIYRSINQMPKVKILSIAYEDLAQKSELTRARISEFLEIELPMEAFEINTHEHHLVAGNGMRHKGKISLKYDDSWKKALTGDLISEIDKIGATLEIPKFL